MTWLWDALRNAYIRLLTTLGLRDLPDLRDEFTAQSMQESDELMNRLIIEGEITLQQWTDQMRDLIRDTYTAQYELAIGGYNNMTQADWGRLGGILNEQYRYLNTFANDLATGQLSPLGAMARGRMYIDSSTQSFERAQAAGFGLALPQYPGDGGTRCLSNCKCNWTIVDTRDSWRCYWKLGEAEHCEDCLRNSRIWNPLEIAKSIMFSTALERVV